VPELVPALTPPVVEPLAALLGGELTAADPELALAAAVVVEVVVGLTVAVVELLLDPAEADAPGTVSDGSGDVLAEVVVPPPPQPATATPSATQQVSAISRRSGRRAI
jgi:hypothetical protein